MTDESLFIAALGKAVPAERRAFLDAACAGNPAQRQRLNLLLAGHDQATGILDHSAAPSDPVVVTDRCSPPAEMAGTVLAGRYKLIEEIGEGGMGSVWVAEQVQPVRRKVAVKLVKAGMDSKAVLARFDAERQALALMDHPHIAKVLDGGTTDAGRPYFVMEYVKGVPITAYCDDARLSVADRLALLVPVCQAVQHAHQKGIIHRDLKPSNILICLYDGKPVPKVIDFGLAKAMHQSLTELTLHTPHGQMFGTPLYMSPEQAEFNNLDVDTRTDVYALGVILYELLTGTTPLERDRVRRSPWDEMLRMIREEEPPRPSARLSGSGSLPSVAAQRQLEPVRLTKLVRGELDWIAMKCLEKDRSRRYAMANGLATDLQRYLSDETVEACPPTAGYRVRKFTRRHWRGLAATSVFVLLLVVSVATLSAMLVTVNQERQAKEAALEAEGKRRKQARAALDTMASELIGDWLARQPAFLPMHERFLEHALRSYEEFARDTGQDEESRAGVAEAYKWVGFIRELLTQIEDAETAFERSRALYAALATDFPGVPTYRHRRAEAQRHLGHLQTLMSHTREAETNLGDALTTYRGLGADDPDAPTYRRGLIMTLNQYGILLKNLKRFAESEKVYNEALAIGRKLTADHPKEAEYHDHLANTYLNRGVLFAADDRPDDAVAAGRLAVEMYERLAVTNPGVPRYRDHLAISHSNLADVLRSEDKLPEAERMFRQALETRRQLAAEFPGVPDYRQGLAITANNLGILLKDTGRATEAEGYYVESMTTHKKLADDFKLSKHQNEAAGAMVNLARLKLSGKDYTAARRLLEGAVPYHQKALEANQHHPAYRKFYRFNRWRLAEACLGLNDHATAADAVAEFLQYTTEPPRDHYTAATLLAGCVQLAIHDERLTEAKRQELANGYGDRAMTALRKSVELKAKEVAQIKSDPALNSLSERSDFQKLLTELGR